MEVFLLSKAESITFEKTIFPKDLFNVLCDLDPSMDVIEDKWIIQLKISGNVM